MILLGPHFGEGLQGLSLGCRVAGLNPKPQTGLRVGLRDFDYKDYFSQLAVGASNARVPKGT